MGRGIPTWPSQPGQAHLPRPTWPGPPGQTDLPKPTWPNRLAQADLARPTWPTRPTWPGRPGLARPTCPSPLGQADLARPTLARPTCPSPPGQADLAKTIWPGRPFKGRLGLGELSRGSGGTLGLRPFGVWLNIHSFLLLCGGLPRAKMAMHGGFYGSAQRWLAYFGLEVSKQIGGVLWAPKQINET